MSSESKSKDKKETLGLQLLIRRKLNDIQEFQFELACDTSKSSHYRVILIDKNNRFKESFSLYITIYSG